MEEEENTMFLNPWT